MTSLLRTPAIRSSGISAQLVRLLPPLGCPGQPVWVPPNEVQRWEQLGFYRAPIPAAALELAWHIDSLGDSLLGHFHGHIKDRFSVQQISRCHMTHRE